MKLVNTTAATIAVLSLLSACTPSGSSKVSENKSPDTKVETQSTTTLTGSYQGLSATCEGGSEATKDHSSTKNTVITFNTDGTFKSETTIENSPTGSNLETTGKFSTLADTLILIKESQSYEGQIGFEKEESHVKYTLTGEELTLNLGPTEDGSCPKNESLITKYQLVK